jgi:pimeloyl-ACP methyl ester carboxylesterase
MPAPSRTGFCKLEDGPEDVNIYYEIHGEEKQDPREPEAEKVLLIMGLACTNTAWRFQVEELTHRAAEATASPLGNRALVMCTFDNRGIGRSSVPTHKSRYTTKIMAEDALVLMDHLGWKSAHIVGFSMGGMIATKLAAMAPHRVLSLCNIAVSGGGWQSLPQNWKAFKYAVRALAATTPHQRAEVDLKFHFTSRSLKQHVSGQHLRCAAAPSASGGRMRPAAIPICQIR